jgi:hypothetical protein
MTRSKIELGLIGIMVMLLIMVLMMTLHISSYGGAELALCISFLIGLFFEIDNISKENNIDAEAVYYYLFIGSVISYLILKLII